MVEPSGDQVSDWLRRRRLCAMRTDRVNQLLAMEEAAREVVQTWHAGNGFPYPPAMRELDRKVSGAP